MRLSHAFFNIFDEEMKEFMFGCEEGGVGDEGVRDLRQEFCLAEGRECEESRVEAEEGWKFDSEEEELNLVPVYGEVFSMMTEAELIGAKKREGGKLVLTNFRLAFLKGKVKMLDLPFGFIRRFRVNKKLQLVEITMRSNNCWEIRIKESGKEETSKVLKFLELYCRFDTIKSCFAFSFAGKFPNFYKVKHPQVID
jgi:hypothetical protein